jgi:hypothetical protein
MIIAMSKVRMLGPRERLPDVLRTLQDLSLLHLAAPTAPIAPDAPLGRAALSASQERERRHLQQVLADIDAGLGELHLRPPSAAASQSSARAAAADFVRWARLAWRVRREAERLRLQIVVLDEKRRSSSSTNSSFPRFARCSRPRPTGRTRPRITCWCAARIGRDPKLRASLAAAIGTDFEIYRSRSPAARSRC